MRAGWKLAGPLAAVALVSGALFPGTGSAADELIVRYEPGADRAGLRESAGVDRRSPMLLTRAEVVAMEPGVTRVEAIRRLRQLEGVDQVEPVQTLELDVDPPDDLLFDAQWALENHGQQVTGLEGLVPGASIAALTAWNAVPASPDVVTAVIDTAIDRGHPDLKDQIWTNPGEIPGNAEDDDGNGLVDDVHGWDFVAGGPVEADDHGTHVAGIIGASAGNGIGISGVSQDANLMPLTACAETCSNVDVIEAAEYARREGAKVVNISLGGVTRSPLTRDVMEAADDVLFVASAGNDGRDPPAFGDLDLEPQYPCMEDEPVGTPGDPGYEPPLENVICVAGSDVDDGKTPGSNFGSTGVDLAAPGMSILSTVPNGNYTYKTGTSMAAPQVAGAASLLRQAEPGLSAAQIKQRILASAEPAPEFTSPYPTVTGGRLDLTRLLNADLTAPALSEPADGATFSGMPVLRWTTPEKRLLYTVELSGQLEIGLPGLGQYRPIGQFPPGRYTWRIHVSETGNDEVAFSEERSFYIADPSLRILKIGPANDRRGGVRVRLRLPSDGKVRVLARAGGKRGKILARASRSRKSAGTLTLVARPNRAGRRASRGRKQVRVQLRITFTPRSGPVRNVNRKARMSAPKPRRKRR